MGIVTLKIDEPQHGQRVRGTAEAVRLRGRILSTGHGTLYYRWYSGLEGELNAPSDVLPNLPLPPKVGSHVLTLTAKDRSGDAPEDIQAVREAGMAGGPPEDGVEAPCVVHVFIAEIVEPSPGTTTATLPRSNSTLSAVAPKQWGKFVDPHDTKKGYMRNDAYHEVNRIRYRWRFQPSGWPDDRSSGDLVLSKEELSFGPRSEDSDVMIVRYNGPLPAGLDTGNYTLTLRVEELVEGQSAPTFGDETLPRTVVLT